jgi:predicted ribosome quality control (RQC) complex YloA/Tae2 family protein
MNFNELKLVVEELKINGLKLLRVFNTSLRTYILEFNKKNVLVSLQEPYLRIYEIQGKYPFKTDKFSHALQKELQGQTVTSMELKNDRIVEVRFDKGALIIQLIPRNPNLILGDISLNPIKPPLLKEQSEEKPRFQNSQEAESYFDSLFKAQEEEKQRELIQKAREKIEKELAKAKKWSELMEKAKLIQASLYSYDKKSHSLLLIGEEKRLNLPRTMSAEAYLEKQLKEVRRLKSLIPILEEKWENPIQSKEKKERKPYVEYISKTGFKIWVGKSAKDNDILSFKLSRGSDIWLHVQGKSGAHVLIKAEKGKEIDRATIDQAKELAQKHSKTRGDVIVAYVKDIKKGKKPGEVFYSSTSLKR